MHVAPVCLMVFTYFYMNRQPYLGVATEYVSTDELNSKRKYFIVNDMIA